MITRCILFQISLINIRMHDHSLHSKKLIQLLKWRAAKLSFTIVRIGPSVTVY
jgi:hypothetical protein